MMPSISDNIRDGYLYLGHFEEYFYDNAGVRTTVVNMVPDGNLLKFSVGQWHNLKSLETGTMFLDIKDCACEPLVVDLGVMRIVELYTLHYSKGRLLC